MQLTAEQALQGIALALARALSAMPQSTVFAYFCAILLFVCFLLLLRSKAQNTKEVCRTLIAIERIKTPRSIKAIPRRKARTRGKKQPPSRDHE